MKDKTIVRLVVAYALMAVITYGHSWNTNYEYNDQKRMDILPLESFLCAACWPLYWSAQAFKPLRPKL
jgi:hypothetical protein